MNNSVDFTAIRLGRFYAENHDRLEEEFLQYISENEWGSGADRIRITDEIFWEWLDEQFLKEGVGK